MKQVSPKPRKATQTTINTHSAIETQHVGTSLARLVTAGSLILLEGPIGSGKTTLMKGLAKALGIQSPITSPTFVLHKQYHLPKARRGIKLLHHIDAYRLHSTQDLRDSIDEYMESSSDGVWVVEWGSQIQKSLIQATLVVHFRTTGQSQRRITITATHG